MGRTTEYTLETAERICEEIASGRLLKDLVSIEGFPCRNTFYRWLDENEEFVGMYTRAKERAADTHVENALTCADDISKDDGNDSVQRSRLQVDMRKWLASKLSPNRYGDFNKTEVNHTGKVELGLGDLLLHLDGRTRSLPSIEGPTANILPAE